MTVLLDSNVLLRLAQATHPMHATARAAVSALQRGGERLHTVPQNAY
jgi:predicted nucleic acid-binding protein